MRVLVLSSYFPPDISATGDQTRAVCERCVELGDSVDVVCTFPHYARRRLDPAYRRRIVEVERRDGMRIVRVPVWVGDWCSKVHRCMNYASLTLTMALGAVCERRPEIVLANSPPVTVGALGVALAGYWGVPCVYHAGDVWTHAIERLPGNHLGMLRALVRRTERFVFAHADLVTTVSDQIRDSLLALGARPGHVVTVPGSADTRHVVPRDRDNPVARRWGLVDTFNVMFSGNIGLCQGLEDAVEAAARLALQMPDVRLVIVGSGATRSSLEVLVRERRIANVQFRDFVPREELPDMLATADVCLVPLRPGVATHSTPSKVYTIMAAARPILASVEDHSETARTVRAAGAGVVIPPTDPDAYCAAIHSLRADAAGRSAMGAAGRAFVEANFSDRVMGDRFREVLSTVSRGAS